MFALDRADSTRSWSRVTRYLNKVGDSAFFKIGWVLLADALEHGDIDFLRAFLPRATEAALTENYRSHISRNGTYRIGLTRVSLLQMILDTHDVDLVDTTVAKWIPLLTRDLSDLFSMRYHTSFHLTVSELVELSEKHASSFEMLVCGLSLVRAYSSLLDKSARPKESLASGECLFAGVSNDQIDANMWSNLVETTTNDHGHGSTLACSFIPLQAPGDLRLLKACIDTSTELESVAMFETEVIRRLLEYHWKVFAGRIHMKQMAWHIVVLIYFSVITFNFDDLVSAGHYAVACALQSVILAISIVFAYMEVKQFMLSDDSFIEHFSDIWNLCDVANIVFPSMGSLLRLISGSDTVSSRIMLALASLSLYFRLLYFFSVFEVTGPLVAMILRIAFDIRYFLAFLFVFILSYTQGNGILVCIDSCCYWFHLAVLHCAALFDFLLM